MFVRFWFHFIFPNREYVEERRKEYVLSKIQGGLSAIEAYAFERVAPEIYQTAVNRNKGLPVFLRYGRWWDKNDEIDMIGINPEDNAILFTEVKWSKNPVGIDILKELQRKSSNVNWGKTGRKEYFCLMSRSGFTREMVALSKKEGILLFEGDTLL